MPGKPFQSSLLPHEQEIRALRSRGLSFRLVAEELARGYGLKVTHNAVYSFLRTRRERKGGLFLEGFSPGVRESLLRRLAAEWTHDSTAMEGNTLTLGDTVKVLELGLTIGGKPLRDHQEVYGHARAIELLYALLAKECTEAEDLFALHRAVTPLSPVDALNPVGDWKGEFNGTLGVENGKSFYMEYASPSDVPALMLRWLADFNRRTTAGGGGADRAVRAYVRVHMSFVRIHPFFDGNGRMARLLANLPVLRSGYPPMLIPPSRRSEYIDLLWSYQRAVGRIEGRSPLLPAHPALGRFAALLKEEWQRTRDMVEEARRLDRG